MKRAPRPTPAGLLLRPARRGLRNVDDPGAAVHLVSGFHRPPLGDRVRLRRHPGPVASGPNRIAVGHRVFPSAELLTIEDRPRLGAATIFPSPFSCPEWPWGAVHAKKSAFTWDSVRSLSCPRHVKGGPMEKISAPCGKRWHTEKRNDLLISPRNLLLGTRDLGRKRARPSAGRELQ